jgi:hypothetical protein
MGRERKNRVVEQSAAMVGVASGVACAFAGARPVSSPTVSVVMLALCGFLVAWAGASASWWALALAAAAAVLVAGAPVVVVLAAVAFVAACVVGARKRELTLVRAVSAGLVVNALARSELAVFFGASSLVAVAACMLIVVVGVKRRPRRIRKRVWKGSAVAGVAALVALLGFGVAAASARPPLTEGNRLARSGLDALNQGQFDTAVQLFDSAERSFGRAEAQLTKPWAWPAHLIPVVSQNAAAATELAAAATEVSADIASTLRTIDVETVRVIDGQIDLAAVEALAAPFESMEAALNGLDDSVEQVDSPWLAGRVAAELDELRSDIARNDVKLQTAQEAVRLAPQMLGADGDRHYLLLFTTPAEARGLGGFPGNFAELRTSDGRIDMTRFGRISELQEVAKANGAQVVGPSGFLDRYGRFGYELGPDGTLPGAPWSNITIPPDFPTVAEVAVELYPQSGGRSIDGVILADVFVLEAILGFAGPVEVDGWPVPISQENAAQVLLKDQYLIEENAERIDFLDEVARSTMDAVLGGALPAPVDLARTLGPLAAEGRLLMWTTDPSEQGLLFESNMLGAFPEFGGADGIGIALTNLGGNKIDAYLGRSLSYESTYDEASGITSATMTLTLTNTAPASGLPGYVIGNGVNVPMGTNRLRICVYSPLSLDSAVLVGDDEERPWERIEEFGVTAYCRAANVASESSLVITLQLSGVLPDPTAALQVWTQPMAEAPVVGSMSRK